MRADACVGCMGNGPVASLPVMAAMLPGTPVPPAAVSGVGEGNGELMFNEDRVSI